MKTDSESQSVPVGAVTRLLREMRLEEAIRFANAAAALSTTVRGAQAGMPGPDQIRRLMKHG